MAKCTPRLIKTAADACVLVLLSVFSVSAQIDPDPNSPTPVLVGIENYGEPAPREKGVRRKLAPGDRARPFASDSTIVVTISNVELLDGEGRNAFRVYAEDDKRHLYRFPVTALSKASDGVYALKVRLRDDMRFWEMPATLADLTVRVTWRGLSSNSLRMDSGRMDFPVGEPQEKIPDGDSEESGNDYVGYRFSGDRMRFLEQAAFGPTPSLDALIRRRGIRTWVAMQFEEPYPSPGNPYPDLALKSTDPANATTGCGMFTDPEQNRICRRDYYSQYLVQNWFFKEAFYGEAQLRHRVAWALAQMWVISGVDTQQASWMIAYHKVLADNAFGNYRNLMKEMTLNPGMGNYLDMARSTRNNPNENYPREILQLFTIGLFMLNADGTLQLDGNGDPIPTYDQNTINNFTKVFTGWTFCNQGCPFSAPGIVNYKDPMILVNNNHDITAKTLLTYTGSTTTNIPACTNCTFTNPPDPDIAIYAKNSLEQTLDNIFYHPNIGPFVSRYLIQHLVTSDPSPAYVARVTAAFNDNGTGVRGDMKAVIRAILFDPEARGNAKTDPSYGKLREPVQLLTNVLRQFGVRGANGTPVSDGVVNGLSNSMAQNTFNSPTVFNFYPPGYIVPGSAMPGPEFALMTTGTSISRANVMNTMVFSQIATGANSPLGTSIDLSDIQALAAADTTSNLMLDELNKRMMHGTMSPLMREKILTAVNSVTSTNPLRRAQQAVYLIATSSQFQIQR